VRVSLHPLSWSNLGEASSLTHTHTHTTTTFPPVLLPRLLISLSSFVSLVFWVVHPLVGWLLLPFFFCVFIYLSLYIYLSIYSLNCFSFICLFYFLHLPSQVTASVHQNKRKVNGGVHPACISAYVCVCQIRKERSRNPTASDVVSSRSTGLHTRFRNDVYLYHDVGVFSPVAMLTYESPPCLAYTLHLILPLHTHTHTHTAATDCRCFMCIYVCCISCVVPHR
jgi:hypothetical protein